MKLKRASKFSLLAVVMIVMFLLMSCSSAFAICAGNCDGPVWISDQGSSDTTTAVSVTKDVTGSQEDLEFTFKISQSGDQIGDPFYLKDGDTETVTGLEAGDYTLTETVTQDADSVSYDPGQDFSVKNTVSEFWASASFYNVIPETIEDFVYTDKSWELLYSADGAGDPSSWSQYNNEGGSIDSSSYTASYTFTGDEPDGYYAIGFYYSIICSFCNYQGDHSAFSTPVEYHGPAAIEVTNTFRSSDEGGKLHIKKIVRGDGENGPYAVSLCPTDNNGDNDDVIVASARIISNGCTYLEVNEGLNVFDLAEYDLQGQYDVYEDQFNENHQGYLVFLADSDWEYDEDSPIAGEGVEGFEVPDETTPVDIDSDEDTYLVIVNQFDSDDPDDDYGKLYIKKIVKGDYPRNGEYEIVVSNGEVSKDLTIERGTQSFSLEDFYEGSYYVSETEPDYSKFKWSKIYLTGSDYEYDSEDEITSEDAIAIDPYENTYLVVVNQFRTSDSGDDPGDDPSDNPGDTPGDTPDEPVVVPSAEPTQPAPEIITVPEPAPELPKTGAPVAVGLGLILAAGGLAIRRIKK